jgi:Na+/H+-dicarboxylate symporter
LTDSSAAAPPAPAAFGASAWVIVAALVAGLAAGMASASFSGPLVQPLSAIANTVGGLWLDALKMVVVPLVMALLIKGVVGSADIASEGRVAGIAVAWFLALYFISALLGAVLMPLLLKLYPLSAAAAASVRSGFAAVDPKEVESSVASVSDFVRSFIPANPFAAASSGQMLQIVVFTLFFAVALAFLEPERRRPVVDLFESVAAAMLVVIGWILALAPIGVFALAFVAGAASGTGLFTALLHFLLLYIAIGVVVLVAAYVVAISAAGLRLSAFARALAPTQAVAFSSQSSTASLPLMLLSARKLGIAEEVVDTVLPLAAALFRVTGPAMNLAVVLFVASVLGLNLSFGAMAAGVAIATFATISAPGLPGPVSYFTSIAPIAMAMGIPIAPLGMLIAVEPVPDMFRTVANVTMDVAVTGAVARHSGRRAPSAPGDRPDAV